MKKVEYSSIVREKLKNLRTDLSARFGNDVSKKKVKQIMDAARSLELFEERGISVTAMFGIECDYRYLYVEHNYLFYRIEQEKIIILELFHEKEDFMWKLFGIDTTPSETYEYWKER